MASSQLNYQVFEKSLVTLELYDLDGKLYKELMHDTLNVGFYSILNNLVDEHLNIRVHKCVMTAAGIASGTTFRDSTYLVYWAPDSNVGYLGYTSDQGEYSTNDRIPFPHLFNLPAFVRTSENSAASIGTFTLSDSVVITLTDTVTGKYMQLTRRVPVGTHSNHFEITWVPASSKVQASGSSELIKKAAKQSVFSNLRDAELTVFAATASERDVYLLWKTATEVNMSRFIVQRSSDQINFELVGQIAANGNSNSEKSYTYTDKSLSSGTYYYRLKMVDNDGNVTYSSTVIVAIALPSINKLSNCYPNPYN